MSKPIFISTELIEPKLRTEFWREVNKPLFEATPCAGQSPALLEGSTRVFMIGSLLTARTGFNQQQYRRHRHTVLQSGLDSYLIQILTSGAIAGDYNSRQVSAMPGDICIMDLAQTMQSQVTKGTRITFSIARKALDKAANWRNLHGCVLKKEWPITQLLTRCLTGLHASGAALSAIQAATAQDAVVSLLACALNGEDIPEHAVTSHSVLGVALRQRVLAFIDQNISMPELSPQLICRRLGVSRAHLYRAFAEDGGVAKVLRDKRLDAAFLALTRTGGSAASITALACRLGFSSGNQFLRAFRARFGTTPSQTRDMMRADAPASSDLFTHITTLHDHAPWQEKPGTLA